MSIFTKVKKIFGRLILICIISELILRATISLYFIYYTLIARPPCDFDKSTFRVICVGESTTFGHPIHGNGYPEQLEKLLNQNFQHKKFKVYNLGVCAITSKEAARHFYRNIINYKPHLAIILVGNNDNTPVRVYSLINKLKTIKLLTFAYEILNGLINKTLEIQRVYSDIYVTYCIPDYIHWREQDHRPHLEYIIDIATKNGCRVLICNYFNSIANTFLRDFSTVNNIPFCDNEKAFKEYRDPPLDLISEDGWHPSYKGYSIIAQNLYDTILKNNLMN